MFKLAGKDTNTFESLLRAIIPLQVKTDFIVEVNRPYNIPVGQWRDRRCATVADVPQCALATLPPAKCGAA